MLDEIQWGNPTREIMPLLQSNFGPLDNLIPQLIQNNPCPANSSKLCREELNMLMEYLYFAAKDKEYQSQLRLLDSSLEQLFEHIIIQEGMDKEKPEVFDTVDCLFDETYPFLFKLKYHFQRPRPYQLGKAYKMKLFPFSSGTANTPSYPSTYALQAKLISYMLSTMFPDKIDYLENVCQDIIKSRLYLGVHYPSDIDFSMLIFDKIIHDESFKKRHGLLGVVN